MKIVGKFLTAVTLLATITVTPASADLRFSHLPLDTGVSGILVTGSFEMTDDLSEFEELVQRHQPVVVSFASPGGSISKALELGRLIRKHGLQTFQPTQSMCASACAFAFMGGAGRHAEHRAIGLHRSAVQPGYYTDVNNAVAAIQQATAEIMIYLLDMGIDPAVLQLSLTTDHGDMYFMSTYEMSAFRVTKDLGHRRIAR